VNFKTIFAGSLELKTDIAKKKSTIINNRKDSLLGSFPIIRFSKKTKKDCFSMIAKIFFTIIKKYINTEGMLGLQDISPIMNNIENDISTQTFSEENFNALNNLLNYNQNNPIYDAYTRDWIRAIIAIYKAMSNGSFQAYEEAFNKSMASCPEIAQNINTIKNIILSFMIKEIWNGETK